MKEIVVQGLVVRSFTAADIPAVMELQRAYADIYPGAVVVPGEYYLSPAFHGGQDVFCAFDGQTLLAYAPVYMQLIEDGPAEFPHVAWVEIKSDFGLAEPQTVKDALLDRLILRAREQAASINGRPTRMTFEYRSSETPAAAYVLARGFQYQESVFLMQRNLDKPIPAAPAPEGLTVRRWKMTSEEEQRAYVAARNECFPEAPITLASWQYMLQAPHWSSGVMIAGFDGEELVGTVSAYWIDEENQHLARPAGYTEDVFVRAPWRGHGLARALIIEGMRFLKEHNLRDARLAVKALNENALSIYQALGYQVMQESRFYSKQI